MEYIMILHLNVLEDTSAPNKPFHLTQSAAPTWCTVFVRKQTINSATPVGNLCAGELNVVWTKNGN